MRLIRDKKGATAIEYALLAGLIGVAAMGAIGSTGSSTSTAFCKVATSLTGGVCGEGEPAGPSFESIHHGLTQSEYNGLPAGMYAAFEYAKTFEGGARHVLLYEQNGVISWNDADKIDYNNDPSIRVIGS